MQWSNYAIPAERLLRMGTGFVVNGYLAKELGARGFGELMYCVALLSLTQAWIGMGAENYTISLLSSADIKAHAAQDRVATVLGARIVVAVLCTIGMVWPLALFYAEYGGTIRVLSIAACLTAFRISVLVLQGSGNHVKVAQIALVGLVVATAWKLFASRVSARPEIIAIGWVVECVVILLLEWRSVIGVVSINNVEKFGSSLLPNFSKLGKYFDDIKPLFGACLFLNIYLRAELIIVNMLLGAVGSGIWSVALMFVTPWAVLIGSMVPRWLHELGGHVEKEFIEAYLIRLMRWSMVCWPGIVVISVVGAKLAILFVFGKAYETILPLVAILSLGVLPSTMGTIQEVWNAHQARRNTVFRKVSVGIPLAAILLWALGVEYGPAGVAVAVVICYSITAVFLNIWIDPEYFEIQRKAFRLSSASK